MYDKPSRVSLRNGIAKKEYLCIGSYVLRKGIVSRRLKEFRSEFTFGKSITTTDGHGVNTMAGRLTSG